MARFDVEGLEPVLEDMKRRGELIGPTADKMLMAGAEEVKQAWRDEAERRRFRNTSDMINSIGYANAPKTTGDVRIIDIYPQGKDKKGTRNAEKAFILHWGTTSRAAQARRKKKKFSGPGIPRTLWIDDADKASGPRVLEVFTTIWDDYLEGK